MVSHSQIVEREKRSEFRIINSKKREILKIKVDGCMKLNGKRSDWLFIDCDNETAYFVELKGSGLDKAIKQLEKTLQETWNQFPDKKFPDEN